MLHMPLARSLAHRYSGKGLDREDLEQVAFLALLKAIQRFDLSKPTEFGAYATPTITGELRRHFRDHGWLVRPPRELQERRQLVTDARSRLEQQLGHDPALDEIAEELEITTDSVREAQVAASNLRPASLDATTADGSRPVLDLFDSNAPRQLRPGPRRGHRRSDGARAVARPRPAHRRAALHQRPDPGRDRPVHGPVARCR